MAETFANYLRRHRKRLDLTQDELAQKAGISQSYVSGLERGINKEPDRAYVKAIARALDVGLNEALTAAGLSPDSRAREDSIGYFADPDTVAIAEAYEGLPAPVKNFVRSQILSAADLAREMDREETVGGQRSDNDVNPTRYPDD